MPDTMQVTKPAYFQADLPPSSPESLFEFRRQFQFLYEHSPLQAVRLFLFYVGSRGLDPVARSMAFWATNGTTYISLLLDTDPECVDSLAPDLAFHAAPLLNELDPQFLFKLVKHLGVLEDPVAILRALRLVPAIGEYSILIPWLRSLVHHSDPRLRARAAKLLCLLRPNKGLIDQHLHSPDSRIRASVLEVLWQPKLVQSGEDLLPWFRAALADPNHRVVANALVGLYRLGETDTLFKMIALCSNKQHLFRAASAWALGFVDDSRGVPILRQLTLDRSFTVRQRASSSLRSLASHKTGENDLPTDTLEIVTA